MAYDFDVITIGGGAAGLTASGLAVTLGASALMVESEKLGGDCTWYGCVPSKTLLKAAKVAHQIRNAGKYGLRNGSPQFSFADLMSYVHRVREEVYEDADRPEIFEDLGVDVKTGHARFLDDHTIEIAGPDGSRRYSGRYIVIATGAKAFVPPINGIDSVPYLTNESLFELTEQPERLAIVGGGPIGTEMAQAFTRLGTKVTVVDILDRILSKDHPDASVLMQGRLEDEGVKFELGAGVEQVGRQASGIMLSLKRDGKLQSLEADALLMATGRRANTSALNLEAAGVETHRGGIQIDDKCRTSRRHIYAVGDVTGEFQFTHMSEHMSKIAVTNALLKVPMKIDRKHVPWVTFTDPEVAHVGATEQDLEDAGKNYRAYRFPYSKVDRAVTESESAGFIRVYAKPSSGKILGADVVGTNAGELISEYALAMKNGVSLRRMSDTIHPYPTFGLGARRAADQWYVQKQSPTLVRILKTIFRYRGPVLEFGPDDIL